LLAWLRAQDAHALYIVSKNIRILLADDRALVRAGIRALVEKSHGMTIVGEAADSHQMLRLARTRRPDVVVMDDALPNGNGLHATVRLHQRQHPRIPVVMLSSSGNGEHASRAFRASASGYLLLKAKPSELGRAIRQVVRGRHYLDSSIAGTSRSITAVRCEGSASSRTALTSRQTETLRMIAEGRNTKEIASILGISTKTVDFHRMQLMNRLKTRTVAGLVREALRRGVVTRI
jgi:DNA-binding NarL/FixJ family response regulator